MTSTINKNNPTNQYPTITSIRDNFVAAATDIEELQDSKLSVTRNNDGTIATVEANIPIINNSNILRSKITDLFLILDDNNEFGLSDRSKYCIYLDHFYIDDTTTDDQAFAAALSYCGQYGYDLHITCKTNRGAYTLNNPLYWNFKRHSVIGKGDVKISIGSSASPNTLINLISDPNSDGNLWHSITHEFKNIAFYGRAGWKFCQLEGPDTSHSPSLSFSYLYLNEFAKGFEIGNNTWINYFKRIFFRNSGVEGFSLVINKTLNAGENLVVDNCFFSGNNNNALSILSGTVEVHYKSCSFDYVKSNLIYKTAQRAKIIYEKCHFEDNGVLQFDVNSDTAAFYISFDTCDWYYTGPSTQLRTSFGKFFSKNKSAKLNIENCIFPIYEVTQNSSLTNLFDVDSDSTSVVKISAKGNTIEQAVNKYAKTISRKLNKCLPLTSSNINTSNSFYIFNTSSSGTYTDSTDVPTITNTNNNEGTTNIIVSTPSIKITGVSGLKSRYRYDRNNRVQVGGLYKRTHNYGVKVNYYTLDNVLLNSLTLGIPGTINAWDTFGQEIIPPEQTEIIEIEFFSNTNTGSTSVISTSELYLNDLRYYQY